MFHHILGYACRGVFVLLLSIISPILALPVCAQALAYQRWAIITAGTDQTAFSDLLTTALTNVQGIELVDRTELEAVQQELQLSTVFSGDGTRNRLQLGVLLHADALVLARTRETPEGKQLQLVIAECRHGARLCEEQYPWTTDQAPALAERVKTLVVETRQRFAHGIQQVFGVPSFVSRSLSHDYDNLQERYGQIVQNALFQYPGVAVIETEEARAIGRETVIGGTEIQRIVPLFVAGEYRVEQQNGQPVVSITVDVSDGAKAIRQMKIGPVSLQDGARWVATALGPKIIADSAGAPPLALEAQIAALGNRAETFARLSSYRYSTALREAALLLNADLKDQRRALAHEYLWRTGEPLWNFSKVDYLEKNAKLAPAVAESTEYYLAAFPHIEYLIRNRQIYLEDAVDFAKELLAPGFLPDRVTQCNSAVFLPECRESLTRAEQEKRRFFDQVYPRSITLPHDASRLGKYEWHDRYLTVSRWTDLILEAVRLHFDQKYMTNEDLSHFRFVIEHYVPEGINFNLPYPAETDLNLITADEYDHFIKEMSQSQHRTAHLLACLRIVERQFYTNHRDPALDMAVRLDEVENLFAEFQTIPIPEPGMPPNGRQSIAIDSCFEGLIRELKKEIANMPPVEKKKPGFGALILQPLEMKIVSRIGGKPEKSDSLLYFNPTIVRCGEHMEVIWSARSIALHRTPGVLEVVYSARESIFEDVAWDGQLIWVAVRGEGLRILNPDGTVAGTVTKVQGLPSAGDDLPGKTRSLVVQAVAPGQVLVVGSFGKDCRAWCARVSWLRGKASVQVFHEATRTVEANEKPDTLRLNSDLAFWPVWKHLYRGAGEQPDPILLVGRGSTNGAPGLSPLQINLHTGKVAVFDRILHGNPSGLDDTSISSYRGELMTPIVSVKAYASPGTLYPNGYPGRVIMLINPFNLDGKQVPTQPRVGAVLPPAAGRKQIMDGGDGWVYVPAELCWYRIDPETMTGQRLTSLHPEALEDLRLMGVSVHYGLMGYSSWENPQIYRITIDETAIPKTDE